MITLAIRAADPNETIRFAAEELKKYLEKLNGEICAEINPDRPCEHEIRLSYLSRQDAENDTVSVVVRGLNGDLRGSNPRSILYAVYRYLEAVGIRWVRHGADGERIPAAHDFSCDRISFVSTARNKYRGMCIEGAVSIENMLDNIDWVAKMGFNIYFIQFMRPTTFFDRWYRHVGNPLAGECRVISNEEAEDFLERMVREIKKRGLIYHAVGHGWTSTSFGLPGKGGWETFDGEISEETRSALAMLDGKRDIWRGVPMNTELCYSNPAVRAKVADTCVSYVEAHPEVDTVHLWLSDGCSNHCECEECRKMRPSDYYVILLNEIDERLTARGLGTKVVFLAYHDLLWAPEQAKLKNPDRFIIMFAPIRRTYKTSYAELGELPEVPPFERNRNVIPDSVEENAAHLKNWTDGNPVNGFSFEYYYWLGEHYGDWGGMNLARIIYEDIRNLERIGMSGIVSCQSQRAFWPTGFGPFVMARTLWDDTVSFEDLIKEYFSSAFGQAAPTFIKHYCRLSELAGLPASAEKFTRARSAAQEMRSRLTWLRAAADEQDFCFVKSLDYEDYHCRLLMKNMEAELALLKKGPEGSLDAWRELVRFVQETESEAQPIFDITQFFSDLEGRKHGELVPYRLIDWRRNE